MPRQYVGTYVFVPYNLNIYTVHTESSVGSYFIIFISMSCFNCESYGHARDANMNIIIEISYVLLLTISPSLIIYSALFKYETIL